MTDMNNNIGDKPIYTARTERPIEKAPEAPVCNCPKCERTFSAEETDLSKDPRELQGRSQVRKSPVVKHLCGAELTNELAHLLENGDFLQEFQEQYYKAALEKGLSPEIAEEKAELALLGLLDNYFED